MLMAPNFARTIPILRIFSVEKAKEYYVQFLGFKVDWEHQLDPEAPMYLQVSKGDLVLHLSEHHGDACPGSALFVDMTGLEALHREITAKGYRRMTPSIERSAWNTNVMRVTDPFGNRIVFNEADRARDSAVACK